MKNRSRTVIVTVLAAVLVLAFVVGYSVNAYRKNMELRLDAFSNETEALGKVMTNFLLGEQRICNNWSHYVNARNMTISEAIEYIRLLKPSAATAHIIYMDDGSYTGRSTAYPAENPDLDTVSYAHVDILDTLSKDEPTHNSINVTRTFVNPIDGVPSIGFCHPVNLRDEKTGADRAGVLMRVVPVEYINREWEFVADEYEGAGVALTDERGLYIFKASMFVGESFTEFYRQAQPEGAQGDDAPLLTFLQMKQGYTFLQGKDGEQLEVAYAPVEATDDRMILTCVPVKTLGKGLSNTLLVTFVAAGLLLILTVSFARQANYSRQLTTAEQSATQAVSMTNNFLSSISRDMRTPLNAILGVTAVAASQMDDREVVADCLRKIGLSGNYLNTVINDVLDVFRLERNDLRLSPAPFSLVDSAASLVNMSQAMIREKNIQFSFHVDQLECEYYIADQVRVNQVLINMMSSALKFVPAGGVVHGEFHERLGQSPETAVLVYSVFFSGGGITQEELDRMDNPFRNREEEGDTLEAVEGADLALALTKKIVRFLNGQLRCRNEGGGTKLIAELELPRGDNHLLADMGLPDVRALIVDENADLRLTVRESLQSLGAVADTAASGQEAIARLKQMRAEGEQDYDVLILGRRMTGLDGIRTAERIRRDLAEPLPKMLISAYDWTGLRLDARDSGVDGFISKPLFRSTLYHKICDVLGREDAAPKDDYSDIAGMRILIAEDNDVNWAVVSNLLGEYGITCERAENGRKAVDRMAVAREGEISMIFMDVRMPVMDGLEATRAIRRLPGANASVPIVAMTAETFAENVKECLEAGMNGHVAKPIDLSHVLMEIRKARAFSRNLETV